jgi:hypothetical protein
VAWCVWLLFEFKNIRKQSRHDLASFIRRFEKMTSTISSFIQAGMNGRLTVAVALGFVRVDPDVVDGEAALGGYALKD